MARKTTKSTSTSSKSSQPDAKALDGKIVEAALRLAAVQGWRDTTMADISAEAGVSLADVRSRFASKHCILAAYSRMVDETVLAGTDPDIGLEPVRDRLFDVLIRRFDALAPHREGLAAIANDLRRDPPAMACLMAGPVRTSMAWTLEAARIAPWGPLAPLQLKGMGLIYFSVLRVWLKDDSEDLSPTMAALDKALSRADSIVSMFRRGPRRRDSGLEAAEASEA